MDMGTSRRNVTAAPGAIRILSSQDLQAVMRFDDYVDAVAEAFRLLAEGRCESPVPLQVSVTNGTFHAKAASLPRGSGYVAVKVNGNFPDNWSRYGLPTIQGAVQRSAAGTSRFYRDYPPAEQRLPLSIWPDRIAVLPRFADAANKAAFNYSHCGTNSTSRGCLRGTSIPKLHAAFQVRWRPNPGSTLLPSIICVKEHWSATQS